MTAKKCDRCGAYYELYGVWNNAKKCNAIMPVNIDGQGKYYQHNPYDLCPECMAALYEFMQKGGNLNEQGPRADAGGSERSAR